MGSLAGKLTLNKTRIDQSSIKEIGQYSQSCDAPVYSLCYDADKVYSLIDAVSAGL